jgi:glyoxylase-like metal-dependent hydrolase (beta-lactamase superfamily II)
MADDIFSVHAVKYGSFNRRRPDNYVGGDPHDRDEPIDYYVWLVQGGGRRVVVDTGFDEAMGKKRGRMVARPIGAGLTALGVPPDTVTDVIVTHMHYDHAGNHDLFPAARYHIQDVEMAYCTGRCMCHGFLKMPFECEDVTAMVGKVFAGRVTFHDGDAEIVPGLTVHAAGGHSKGLQCVRVNTARGAVVLASDATHLYEHIEQDRIFPITYSPAQVLESYARIRKLAASRDHIIPGHDPKTMAWYPPSAPGLEGWAARLDVMPDRR